MTIYDSLINFWVEEFHKRTDIDDMMKFFCGSTVMRQCFLWKYKFLPPIELMLEKEKAEMKEFVIDLFKGKSVSELVENAKIIYTLGTIL